MGSICKNNAKNEKHDGLHVYFCDVIKCGLCDVFLCFVDKLLTLRPTGALGQVGLRPNMAENG